MGREARLSMRVGMLPVAEHNDRVGNKLPTLPFFICLAVFYSHSMVAGGLVEMS